MNARAIDLSVIVVNWNTRDLLAQCLQSVYDTAGDLAYEVFVVDNGSTDGSVEMVESRFPQVKVLRNVENVGFARANNQGLASCQGRFILLLNSDAVLLTGAVEGLTGFLRQRADVGIVGPKVLNPDGSFQSSYMDFPTLLSELLLMTKLHRLVYGPCFPSHPPEKSHETRSADWVSGACLMVRRQVLDAIGGLDEDFFIYSEEVDWCWRARQAGWGVCYLPEAGVLHWGGQSSVKAPLARRSLVYRSKLRFLRKNYGNDAARVYRCALAVTSYLKIGLWALLSWHPAPSMRERAMANVVSYRQLLVDLEP